MNDDRLRLDLADLADEVTPVDLRDRALRTSRRLGIQRAIATSAAAVVMLGAASGTAFALMPRNDGQGPAPADTPSVTVAPTPVEVSPTPEPSATADPTTVPSSPPARPVVLDGARYYLDLTGSEAVIHVVRRGRHDMNVLPLDKSGCVANSMTISPDGKRVAWVKGGNADGMNGTLVTSRIDGTRQRTLATGVNCLGPRPLVWQGGDRLMAAKGSQSVLFDMVAGQPIVGDPGQETDRCWSADGKWLAAFSDGEPYVADGKDLRKYQYTPPKEEATKHDGWQARSVSMDGRYVAVGWNGTDPSRQDGSFAVVDTTTSKVVDLPGGSGILSIMFTADDKVIVQREKTLTVLDADFQQLGTVSESASVRGQRLLAYVP